MRVRQVYQHESNNGDSSSVDYYPSESNESLAMIEFRIAKSKVNLTDSFCLFSNKLKSSSHLIKKIDNNKHIADYEFGCLIEFVSLAENHLFDLADNVDKDFTEWFDKIEEMKKKLKHILETYEFEDLEADEKYGEKLKIILDKIEIEINQITTNYPKFIQLKQSLLSLCKVKIDPLFFKVKRIDNKEMKKLEGKFLEMTRIRNTFCRHIIQFIDNTMEDMFDNLPKNPHIFHSSVHVNGTLKSLANYYE